MASKAFCLLFTRQLEFFFPSLLALCSLQAVMCIISTIMESCPSTSSFYSTAAAKTQHNGMNNIIRLFLKKGLVNDLARVPHSLDLSRYSIVRNLPSHNLKSYWVLMRS